ncbi:MAG: matrixin family metalloprotease [Cyanobacteria bacterium J06560_2]
MAGIKTNTPSAGAVAAPVEGKTIWSTPSLTYAFATTADQTQVVGELASGRTGTYNAIDTETNYRTSVLDAFAAFEKVSKLNFTVATGFNGADIKIAGFDNYIRSATATQPAAGLNGSMNFPGSNPQPAPATDFESYLFLNTNGTRLNLTAEQGGANALMRVTLHEIGHGLGLGHPHDVGNGTTTIGSSSAADSPENPLDNERYTVMSYERGGLNVKTERQYGHAASLSALDIAAIQGMYGADTTTNSTNTTYTLVDRRAGAIDTDGSDGSVQIGRAFFSIWDTGGTDSIEYNGSKRVVLNLNDATLSKTDDAETKEWIKQVKQGELYSELPSEFQNDIESADYHAGGFFSRVFQNATASGYDLGGYSIANGVEIENAAASSGNDFVMGNELDNTLEGKGGKDFLHGANGKDTLEGGAGDDELVGGRGDDTLEGGAGDDTAIYSGNCADYDITRDAATGTITIAHQRGDMIDGSDMLQNIENARFKDGTVDLTAADLGCPPIDFIFLVDLSGSYADDLPNFVTSARSIANSVLAAEPDSQFAVASFIDLPVSPYGSPGDYLYRSDLALTDSITDFETSLAGLSTRSGNDFPEAQYVGLWRAANGVGLNLRENSRKVILIATDAPPHSAADYGLNESNIRDFLENEGITVAGGASATVASGADAAAPVGDFDFVGETPGPDDTGNGIIPDLPAGETELLLSELSDTFALNGATPIFAVTPDQRSAYDAIETELGRGSTVTLDRNSENIADAVRLALAEITGTVTDSGSDGDDTLIGTGDIDNLFGGPGNDQIEGRGNDDVLDGGSDNDTILGEAGDDTLRGGSGDDSLDGGAGNDIIEPGLGKDAIALGSGDDIVQGTALELDGDTIQDFALGDRIVVLGEAFSEISTATTGGGSTILFLGADSGANLELVGDFSSSQFVVEADPEAPEENTIIRLTGDVPPPPPAPSGDLFLNFGKRTRLAGEVYEEEDIVGFDGETFTKFFDGSDVGLKLGDINAMDIISNTEILLSFERDTRVAGLGKVKKADVVKFTATSLGEETAGTFELYFDSSDVGLSSGRVNVDAITGLSDGSLLISTDAKVTVGDITADTTDLLLFTPGSVGKDTSGTLSLYFDGSDVGLADKREKLNGVSVNEAGQLLLTTRRNFAVPGVSGSNKDVFVYTAGSIGDDTSGSFESDLLFDGSEFGVKGNTFISAIDSTVGL